MEETFAVSHVFLTDLWRNPEQTQWRCCLGTFIPEPTNSINSPNRAGEPEAGYV